jgi:hypothetical protein
MKNLNQVKDAGVKDYLVKANCIDKDEIVKANCINKNAIVKASKKINNYEDIKWLTGC